MSTERLTNASAGVLGYCSNYVHGVPVTAPMAEEVLALPPVRPATPIAPPEAIDTPSDPPERTVVQSRAASTAAEAPSLSPKRGETIAASGTEEMAADVPERSVTPDASAEAADCSEDAP